MNLPLLSLISWLGETPLYANPFKSIPPEAFQRSQLTHVMCISESVNHYSIIYHVMYQGCVNIFSGLMIIHVFNKTTKAALIC